jgi:hypothetical protein
MNMQVRAGERAQQDGVRGRRGESEQTQGGSSVENAKFAAPASEKPVTYNGFRNLDAFG